MKDVGHGGYPWLGNSLGDLYPLTRFTMACLCYGNLHDEWEIFPMSHGYLIFRFITAEGLDRVLLDGLWSLDDVVLALDAWTPDSRPSLNMLPSSTVWLRLLVSSS